MRFYIFNENSRERCLVYIPEVTFTRMVRDSAENSAILGFENTAGCSAARFLELPSHYVGSLLVVFKYSVHLQKEIIKKEGGGRASFLDSTFSGTVKRADWTDIFL